ncbi:DUF3953 domain-containing protein [Lysinibacillus fusiformis]|uniref:DUF3953 domain-containing protein n=1 Tax=Lysinibacillus fusiformis TaxID=28031 RepID=UPI0037FFE49B
MTHDYWLNFLMILFLGLFMLTLGINEFRRERKLYGWFLVGYLYFRSMCPFKASYSYKKLNFALDDNAGFFLQLKTCCNYGCFILVF